MTFEILVSTMHQNDRTLLEKMKINSDAVIVNQCDREGKEQFLFNGHKITWIDTTERGLSKSRNMAIRESCADIIKIADDDMEFKPDCEQLVLAAFDKTGADIIAFQVHGIEKEFKKYSPQAGERSYLKSMKISSVELAFKRSALIENNIAFDEHIGAGTEFLMGEESALLFECIRKGLRLFYVPQVIADLHIGNSSWFTKMDAAHFIGRGAAFAAMKTPFTMLLILQFAIRKYSRYRREISMPKALLCMHNGRKLYLNRIKGR